MTEFQVQLLLYGHGWIARAQARYEAARRARAEVFRRYIAERVLPACA